MKRKRLLNSGRKGGNRSNDASIINTQVDIIMENTFAHLASSITLQIYGQKWESYS